MKTGLLFLIAAALFMQSCASVSGGARTASQKSMPSWIGKTVETADTISFSGSATGKSTFEDARSLAVADALDKAASMLDLKMSAYTKTMLTEMGSALESSTEASTIEVRLGNAKIADIYYERLNGRETYNVYVLVEFARADFEAEKARIAKLYKDEQASVTNKYRAALDEIKQKDYFSAFANLVKAYYSISCYGVGKDKEADITGKLSDIWGMVTTDVTLTPSGGATKVDVTVAVKEPYTAFSGLTFNFKTNKGSFELPEAVTNSKGLMTNTLKGAGILGGQIASVTLNLNKSFNLKEDFDIPLNFTRNLEIDIALQNGLVKAAELALKTNEIDGIDKKSIEFSIMQPLTKAGFNTVFDRNGITLKADVNIQKPQKTPDGITLITGQVKLQFVSNKDSRVLNDLSVTVKAFGADGNLAASDFLRQLSNLNY